jgi:small subunit ribosomal protein S11
MPKVVKRSKKTRKNIPEVVVSISAGLNNTHVVVSDVDGNVLTWSSGGAAGFK